MIQSGALRILGCFIDRETIGFADMCKSAGYPTDLGGYYIRQLTKSNYLEKVDRGQYRLLPKGKQELAINYGRRLLAPRPRLAVIIIASQGERLCVIRRKIQPFIGTIEWPAGIVAGGETLPAAAQRIGNDRFGIAVSPKLRGFFRRIDRYDGIVFDDKLFAVHTCDLPADATIVAETMRGENSLLTSGELDAVPKLSRSLLDILRFSRTAIGGYQEHSYDLTSADLSLED